MVSDEQLIEWSTSGKNELESNAYNRFKEVIYACFDVDDIFLQGSYANSTEVPSSSDIDIVVVCKGPRYGTYTWESRLKKVKYQLYNSIKNYHNFHFEMGKKTIKYNGSSKYSPTDILPCISYINTNGEQGIVFYDHRNHRLVFNYPKQHKANGIAKNERTQGEFKRIVRVFKNVRDSMIDDGTIRENLAPSYFVECLLYNVPDSCYTEYIPDSFHKVLKWLAYNKRLIPQMRCQNGIQSLFNGYSGWGLGNCYMFIDAIVREVQYDARVQLQR